MNLLYSLVAGMAKLTTKLLYRHSVYGLENFIPGPALICPNHTSHFDPVLVAGVIPEHIHFLGKSALFKFKLFGKIISALQCHPVSHGKENLETLKTVFHILKNGSKLFMAPEGTRSRDGRLHKGLEGIGYVILKSRCPVIPVYIEGNYDIWSVHRKFPKLSGKMSCVFGKPLYFDEFFDNPSKNTRQEIVDKVMAKIAELKIWMENGKRGEIP